LGDFSRDGVALAEASGIGAVTMRSAAAAIGTATARWQESLAQYLVEIAAAGQHPHLATALTDQAPGEPAAIDPAADEPTFDRAMTRILNGLLQPAHP
jgi:hypothetical protein